MKELPFRTRLAVRIHFGLCRLCRQYHGQIRLVEALVERQDEVQTDSLGPAARQRIKKALEQADARTEPGDQP